MKRSICLLTSLLLTSGICRAAAWTGELTVASAFTEGKSDFVVLYTSDGSSYTAGCSVNNWIFTADTETRRNRAYATIMAALVSGQKIKLWVTDSCAAWQYHEATSVMLVK